jgi:thioredoxin reductase
MSKGGHPMIVDCAIIGGGPAGLNAALVLGRARRRVMVFDDNQPRNAVTQEAHGFLTRDGVKPAELRAIAHQELSKYPSVELQHVRVTTVRYADTSFEITTAKGDLLSAKTVLLATGLKEVLSMIAGLQDYYGKSVFCCPYCDGWELREKPLVVISEGPHTFQLVKVVWNWSHDLLVCTNGHQPLTEAQQETLRQKGIPVVEDQITALVGNHGQLEQIVFATQEARSREGGFVAPQLLQAAPFGELLGCEMNGMGGIVTDPLGRTTVPGVYAAGDVSVAVPHQLIIAAAAGSRAAAGVNTDLTESEFL